MAQRIGRSLTKETHWRNRLLAQADSGLSTAQWCRENKISTSLFYFWKRTIAQRDGYPKKPMQKVATISKSSAAFVRVRVTPSATVAAVAPMAAGLIEILLGNGLAVYVAPGFDEPTLARVLDVLEARTC